MSIGKKPAIAVSAAQQTDRYKQLCIAMGWMIFSVFCLLVLVGQVHAGEENLYAKHYKAQSLYPLKSMQANPDTQLYVSNHKEEDNVTMLEKGYDMMGTTGFTATDVAPELALEHGKAIQADTVLVYTKYSSAKAQASRKEFLKAEAKKAGKVIDETLLDEVTVYDYFASYWAKIPMPTFGVHIIKLNSLVTDYETDEVTKHPETGLKVVAVIRGSSAAKANILHGDSLLKIGDAVMDKPDDLFAAIKQYKGKTVTVVVKRGKKVMKMPVTLVKS